MVRQAVPQSTQVDRSSIIGGLKSSGEEIERLDEWRVEGHNCEESSGDEKK